MNRHLVLSVFKLIPNFIAAKLRNTTPFIATLLQARLIFFLSRTNINFSVTKNNSCNFQTRVFTRIAEFAMAGNRIEIESFWRLTERPHQDTQRRRLSQVSLKRRKRSISIIEV